MVRHLHQAGHRVTVASLSRDGQETAECQGIADYCTDYVLCETNETMQKIRMVGRLFTSDPSSMGYFYSPELAAKIKALLAGEEFDLIMVFSSSAAQYVEHVTHIPKILDFCDMDSQKWLAYAHYKNWPLSMGYRLEGHKLERDEKRLAGKFDLCTCATDFEVDTLDGYGTGVASARFSNGVDCEFFAPTDVPYKKHSISFVGRMDYYPNAVCVANFCHQILPKVREKYPDVTFSIIGAAPTQAVMDLGKLPGVTVTGTVDDIRPHVQQSALMVAPLVIARGTQNKILEGMAMGVPVLSSVLAARGVDAVMGEHLLAATAADEYVGAVSRIFEDDALRRSLGQAGRERVMACHNWETNMAKLDEIIDQCRADFRKTDFSQTDFRKMG